MVDFMVGILYDVNLQYGVSLGGNIIPSAFILGDIYWRRNEIRVLFSMSQKHMICQRFIEWNPSDL